MILILNDGTDDPRSLDSPYLEYTSYFKLERL